MTISAQVICDSISQSGHRITSLQLRYPRFIHAEFMTHRVFSRNASSSRAIPVKRIIEDIVKDTAMPIHWGKNQTGMQAFEELEAQELEEAKNRWMMCRDDAIYHAEEMIKLGAHKQLVNRLLEPFSHINVLVTATEFANFFHLRSHKDAQPEIKELSDRMKLAMSQSKPQLLQCGEWHLPYVRPADFANIYNFLKYGRITRDEPAHKEIVDLAIKVSVARSARNSYLTHSGRETKLDEDMLLYDRLLKSQPLHASPAEHQASPDQLVQVDSITGDNLWANQDRHGNFVGWIQYRKTLPYENFTG